MNQKQFEALFDMVCHTVEKPSEDYTFNGISLNPVQTRVFVGRKIQAFLMEPGTIHGTKRIQAFGTSTDVAKIDTNVFNANMEFDNFDTNWSLAFRNVPVRKGQLEWSIGKVNSGTAFKKLSEGEKVDFYGITGEVVKAEIDLYGMGLMLTWRLIEGRDLAAFYDKMVDFRSKRQLLYADTHYGLLATAALNNQVPYQGVGTDTQVSRDIATINKARSEMAVRLKDKGFGDVANARYLLYYNDNLRERMSAAMRVTSGALVAAGAGQNAQEMYANLSPISTLNTKVVPSKALLIYPGQKIQNSMYMNEKVFERVDPDSMNYLKTSFTAFGAIVGDNDQCSELSFS